MGASGLGRCVVGSEVDDGRVLGLCVERSGSGGVVRDAG